MLKDALMMQVFAHLEWDSKPAQTTKALPRAQATSIPAVTNGYQLSWTRAKKDKQHQHHLLLFQLLDS